MGMRDGQESRRRKLESRNEKLGRKSEKSLEKGCGTRSEEESKDPT